MQRRVQQARVLTRELTLCEADRRARRAQTSWPPGTPRRDLSDHLWGIIYWRASLGRSLEIEATKENPVCASIKFQTPRSNMPPWQGWFPAFLRRRRCKVQRGPTYDLGSHDAERASSTRSTHGITFSTSPIRGIWWSERNRISRIQEPSEKLTFLELRKTSSLLEKNSGRIFNQYKFILDNLQFV